MFDFYSFLDNTDYILCLYELFRLFNEAVSVTHIVNRPDGTEGDYERLVGLNWKEKCEFSVLKWNTQSVYGNTEPRKIFRFRVDEFTRVKCGTVHDLCSEPVSTTVVE